MNIYNVISNLPLVTDFPSRKHWEGAVWEILIDRLAKVESEADLKKIVQFLVGPYEQHVILYRALAGSRLHSGIGSSEIGRELWVSRSTISAIKKSLEEGGEYKSSHVRGHKKIEYSAGLGRKEPKMHIPTVLGEVRRSQRLSSRRGRR